MDSLRKTTLAIALIALLTLCYMGSVAHASDLDHDSDCKDPIAEVAVPTSVERPAPIACTLPGPANSIQADYAPASASEATSTHTVPVHDYSREVGSSYLQHYLARYIQNYGDMRFTDFMNEYIAYKGTNVSDLDITKVLTEQKYKMDGDRVLMKNTNALTCINDITLKDFALYAVSDDVYVPSHSHVVNNTFRFIHLHPVR